MSQLVSPLKAVLFISSCVFVGLTSPEALADGTLAGNPPKTLHLCGRVPADAQTCGEATTADLLWVLLTPAPPGGDGTDPRLLLCGPAWVGGPVHCEQTTLLDWIVELM